MKSLMITMVFLFLVGCGSNITPEKYKYEIIHNVDNDGYDVYYTNTNDLHLEPGFLTFQDIRDKRTYTLSGTLVVKHNTVGIKE